MLIVSILLKVISQLLRGTVFVFDVATRPLSDETTQPISISLFIRERDSEYFSGTASQRALSILFEGSCDRLTSRTWEGLKLMTKTPPEFIEPKNLKFLRLLVIVLTITMICGIITLVLVIVIKMPNYNNTESMQLPAMQLPAEIILPDNMKVETFSIGSNHYLIVTKNDEVLIYDRRTNILEQRIKIK